MKPLPIHVRGVEISLGLSERPRGERRDSSRERERCGQHRGGYHHVDERAKSARRGIKRRLPSRFEYFDRQRRENMRDYKIK